MSEPSKKMSEITGKLSSGQQRTIKNQAIPQWAQGLYYNKGVFSEVLIYHEDEALYFEHKGKESGIVRYTFEMLEGLTRVEEENGDSHN